MAPFPAELASFTPSLFQHHFTMSVLELVGAWVDTWRSLSVVRQCWGGVEAVGSCSEPSLPSRSWECFPPLSKAGAASRLAASLVPWDHSLPLPLLFPRQRSPQSAQSDGSCCSKSTRPALMWSGISGSQHAQAEPGGSAQTQGRRGAVARGDQLCLSRHLSVTKASSPLVPCQGNRDILMVRSLAYRSWDTDPGAVLAALLWIQG